MGRATERKRSARNKEGEPRVEAEEGKGNGQVVGGHGQRGIRTTIAGGKKTLGSNGKGPEGSAGRGRGKHWGGGAAPGDGCAGMGEGDSPETYEAEDHTKWRVRRDEKKAQPRKGE